MEKKQNKMSISRRHVLAGLVATGAGLSASFATALPSFAATRVFAQNPTPLKLKATIKQSQVAFKHQTIKGKSGRAPFKSYTLKTNTQAGAQAAPDLNATFTAYLVKTSSPHAWNYGITRGHDGSSFWFAISAINSIGKITTRGAITQYLLPLSDDDYKVVDITTGPGDTYWFTYYKSSAAYIGCLVGASGQATLYLLPDDFTGGNALTSITSGLNNTIWFTSSIGNIGSITPDGAITTFALSGVEAVNKSVRGADGALWFTFYGKGPSNGIGRLTASGDYTCYSMPPVPFGITTGRHNDFWFTEINGGIGNMTTGGQMTEYQLPSGTHPEAITSLGNDTFAFGASYSPNNVGSPGYIGIINPAGDVQLFKIPDDTGAPYGVVYAGWAKEAWFATEDTVYKFRVTN